MSKFVRRVAATVARYRMIPSGDRVLLAISGGPDSVALSWALHELSQEWSSFSFDMILAHFNHNLRDGADDDEKFCGHLARQMGLKLVTGRADVAQEARQYGRSLEEAARHARYRFLEHEASRLECSRIALGHTQNDQAETLLLRLLRGSGTTGLAAMYPVRNASMIRPMLDLKRREVMDFLHAKKIPFCLDPTNDDCSIPRNRIRHRALPFLEKEFNPALVDTLARSARLFQDEEDWMEQAASDLLHEVISTQEVAEELHLPASWIESLHPAMSRRVIRAALKRVRGHLRGFGLRHIDEILRLSATGKSGRQLALPGVDCIRSFEELWFRRVQHNRHNSNRKDLEFDPEILSQDSYNRYEYKLPVPGRLEIPEAGGRIQAEELVNEGLPAASGPLVVVALPEERGKAIDLRVRSPKRGDRFQALGAPGSKALSRYLMDRRVERDRRGMVPLVVHGERRVLWVVGYGVSELSRIAPESRRMVRLSWVQV